GWLGAERAAADRRLWAAQEVANVMEQLSAEPFDRVDASRARAMAAEGQATRALPGAEWGAEVVDEPDGPVAAKRVTLRLRWKGRSGEWEAPARLTSWVYRRGGRP